MHTQKLLSKKKGYTLFAFMGIICAFLWKAERDLAPRGSEMGNILWNGSYVLEILLFSLLVGSLTGAGICFLIYGAAEEKWIGLGQKLKEHTRRNRDRETTDSLFQCIYGQQPWKLFLGSLLLTFLSWLPAYLAYYPGICSYDTTIQLGQIVEGPYIDHHPLAHTLLLQGFMELGTWIFGSVNVGIGMYAAVQMLFLAGAFAYGITVLCRREIKWGWLTVLQLYCMVYPFHWYMSVTTVKDTVFSGFFFLQIMSFYVLLSEGKKCKFINAHSILFVISTVGMILFRNNGKYAMLVLLAFLLLALWRRKENRRFWGRILAYALVGFLLGSGLVSALFAVTKAEQGDRREMLSMPIQQLARTMIYHGGVGVLPEDDNTLSPEAKALLNDFLLNESYKEYRPDIADPVKRHTNTYVARYRAKEFISTYLELLVQYPGDFINAALAVNAGYFSPSDVSHAVINVNGRDSGLGYIQTRWVENELNPHGIYKVTLWEGLHEKLEKWADENAYLDIPVLKYLFVPGSYLWLYLLFAGYLAIHRKNELLMPLALVLGYYGTLILGPTVQLRYIYPLIIILPFLVFFTKKAAKS